MYCIDIKHKQPLLGDVDSYMSSFSSGNKWSDCNKKDFEAWYLYYKDNWCMGDATEGNSSYQL